MFFLNFYKLLSDHMLSHLRTLLFIKISSKIEIGNREKNIKLIRLQEKSTVVPPCCGIKNECQGYT
jgi:hypothetical protein